jgi:hypothetical protein
MDEDFNFDFDDLTPEEKEILEREEKARKEYLYNHPLFLKARDILGIVSALVESFPDEEVKEMYSSTLTESALMLAPKIAGALGSHSWTVSMQNASIIRYHAEYLLTATSGIPLFFEKADRRYVQVLRDEMLEFRDLFQGWMLELNQLQDEEYVDEWGLFIRRK